jgi:hypothetical protein
MKMILSNGQQPMSNLGRNVSQCLIDNMATRQTALLALEAA